MGPLSGVLLLARFRAAGLARFSATPRGFVHSLLPVFVVVALGAAARLLTGDVGEALSELFTITVMLLMPAVISHALALRWQREANWLRYAVAYNWCQTAMIVPLLVMILVAATAESADQPDLIRGGLVGIGCYSLVLNWFVAWRGLAVTPGRAVVTVLASNIGTALLIIAVSALAMPSP